MAAFPAGSVVVSGNLPGADGKYSLYCAVIVKRVDAQTRAPRRASTNCLRALMSTTSNGTAAGTWSACCA